MYTRLIAVVLVATSAAAIAAQSSATPPWALKVVSIPAPTSAASGQPQLATSAKGVLLSWVERSGATATLKFAERTPTGWTSPKVVASGDNWFVNWADVPSVIRLPNGTLVGHWLQKSGPGTYAYDVRLAYSTDDGRTFSPSFLPHHDGTKTEHGFASLMPVNDGLGLVWLDGRATQAPEHSASHDGGGAMTLRYASFDSAWKQTADMLVDAKVCDCCPTTAVMTADGPLVAFRDRTDQEIRDIHVARLENGSWTTSKAVGTDNWNINACPVNGPMLSARGRDVAISWFTAADKQPRSFVAFSRDAGRTFGAPVRIDDNGTLGRVDVDLLDDGSAVASWIEHANGVAEFRVRRIEPSGARSPAVTIATITSDRTSGYPRMARLGKELVFAWLEADPGQPPTARQLQLRTAVATVPAAK
jgi:hypothetical protein